MGRHTGSNAVWTCACGLNNNPLVATQFRKNAQTRCQVCGRRYRFSQESGCIEEIPPDGR